MKVILIRVNRFEPQLLSLIYKKKQFPVLFFLKIVWHDVILNS